MENKQDLSSEFLNIIDNEIKELLGEKKAWELRCSINKRLSGKIRQVNSVQIGANCIIPQLTKKFFH